MVAIDVALSVIWRDAPFWSLSDDTVEKGLALIGEQ